MGKVYDKYRELFGGGTDVEVVEPDADAAVDREALSDARSFVATGTYQEFRRRLVSEIESEDPDPVLGTDAAAAFALRRSGLRRALKILDALLEERTHAA